MARLSSHTRTTADAARSERACRGAATAELAVVLPLALVLMLGGVDFGRCLYQLTAVEGAATSGAKYGAHDAAHSGDINGMKTAARDDLRNSVDVTTVAVDAERYCLCEDTMGLIDCQTGVCAGGPGLKRAYVHVTVDKPFNTLFPYPGLPNAVMLSREARMRVQ